LFTGRLPENTRKGIAAFGLEGLTQELGDLPAHELVRLFRQAGLLLAINYDGWETIIPGKLYEYWAAGGPPVLLLSGPGAARDLVENHGLGISVDADDTDAIARAIWKVYCLYEAGQPLRLSRAGIEAFDRRRLAARLAQLLDRVACGGAVNQVSQDRACT
jgi:glycosyltransferase involved in cell wall biosynthesis